MFKIENLKYRICLILLLSLIIVLSTGRIPPSNAFSDPAIGSLTSQISILRTRVDRLETEVRSVANSLRSNTSTSRSIPPRSTYLDREPSRTIQSSDPMFQNLATLVIELKEEIRNLEGRLKKVEDTLY